MPKGKITKITKTLYLTPKCIEDLKAVSRELFNSERIGVTIEFLAAREIKKLKIKQEK